MLKNNSRHSMIDITSAYDKKGGAQKRPQHQRWNLQGQTSKTKVNKYKAGGMSHIIDDFLFVEPANSSQCFHDLQNFLHLCQRLGVPIKHKSGFRNNGKSPSTRQDCQNQYCTNISYA